MQGFCRLCVSGQGVSSYYIEFLVNPEAPIKLLSFSTFVNSEAG